jgi:hypothetical protein
MIWFLRKRKLAQLKSATREEYRRNRVFVFTYTIIWLIICVLVYFFWRPSGIWLWALSILLLTLTPDHGTLFESYERYHKRIQAEDNSDYD